MNECQRDSVQTKNRKMKKSRGNFFSLRHLFQLAKNTKLYKKEAELRLKGGLIEGNLQVL